MRIAKKGPRAGFQWTANEIKTAIILLANGYSKVEVCNYLGRGIDGITALLNGFQVTTRQLRSNRGLTKQHRLKKEPLPAYHPEVHLACPRKAFPSIYFDTAKALGQIINLDS